MKILPNTRLGAYEMLSPLGAGGTGEAYCARDSRLQRSVAIKILSEGLSVDPERLQRFEREARAASSLNRPSIVTIYEFGREGDLSCHRRSAYQVTTRRRLTRLRGRSNDDASNVRGTSLGFSREAQDRGLIFGETILQE